MTTKRTDRRLGTAALATMLVLLVPTAALPDSGPDTFKAWQNRWSRLLDAMGQIKPDKHITYERHRTPSQGSVVTLPEPLPPDQDIDVEVEWFFTYLSDSQNAGRITYIFDQWITFWLANLRQHGLDNVRLIRSSNGSTFLPPISKPSLMASHGRVGRGCGGTFTLAYGVATDGRAASVKRRSQPGPNS